MDSVKSVIVELGVENADLKRKLEESKKKLREFGDSASEANGSAAAATKYFKDQLSDLGGMITGAFATGAIVSFASEAVAAYDEQLKAEKRLLFALGNRMDIQEDLLAQSESLRAATGIDDGAIINAQTFSLAQGRSAEETKKLVAAAVDLSAVLGTSVEEAAMQLNATYEGTIGRMGKLDSRLKDLTKEQLMNGEAVDLLAQKYKGFGEASATSLDKAKSNWDELKEATARFASETFDQSFMGRLFNDFFGSGDTDVEKAGKNLAKKIQMGLDGKTTTEKIDYMKKAIIGLNKGIQSLNPELDDNASIISAGGIAMTELVKTQTALRSQLADETARLRQNANAWEERNQKAEDAKKVSKTPEVKRVAQDYNSLNWDEKRRMNLVPTEDAWWNKQGEAYEKYRKDLLDFIKESNEKDAEEQKKANEKLKDIEDKRQKDEKDAKKKHDEELMSAREEFSNAFISMSSAEIKSMDDFLNSLRSTMRQAIATWMAGAIAKALYHEADLGLIGVVTGAAAGAAFAGLFSQIPSFAQGGDVYGPQLAWVGDNPGRHEKIIPSEDFNKLTSATSGRVQVDLNAMISGRNLLITTKRAQRDYHIKTGRR